MSNKTLCPRCLMRGDYVPMRVGHLCLADECRTCGALRVARVLDWNQKQGYLSALDPCQACTHAALVAFKGPTGRGRA